MRSSRGLIVLLFVVLSATWGCVRGKDEPAALAVQEEPADFLAPDEIEIEQAVQFFAVGSAEVITLDPGNYRVHATEETQLRLEGESGSETIVVPATLTRHEGDVAEPAAQVDLLDGDELHIVLFRPDGFALDAVGSLSGVVARGRSRYQPRYRPVSPKRVRRLLRPAPSAPVSVVAEAPEVGRAMARKPGVTKALPRVARRMRAKEMPARPAAGRNTSMGRMKEVVRAGSVADQLGRHQRGFPKPLQRPAEVGPDTLAQLSQGRNAKTPQGRMKDMVAASRSRLPDIRGMEEGLGVGNLRTGFKTPMGELKVDGGAGSALRLGNSPGNIRDQEFARQSAGMSGSPGDSRLMLTDEEKKAAADAAAADAAAKVAAAAAAAAAEAAKKDGESDDDVKEAAEDAFKASMSSQGYDKTTIAWGVRSTGGTATTALGKSWAWVTDTLGTSETKEEFDNRNRSNPGTVGVRGQCPPETMTCGPNGKTWAQLTQDEKVAECKRAEDYKEQVMGDRYVSGASRCDNDPKNPDWLALLSGSLNPYILTDDAGEDGAPTVQAGTPIHQDPVGSLPDPGKDGSGTGGGGTPRN